MTAMIYLFYYLLPEELFPGFFKWYGVVIVLAVVLIAEGLRLKTGKLLFGMRNYEKNRVSAFTWFAIGMSLALLFFKMEYVVPVIIGMALVDPLIGEIRRRKAKLYPFLPSLIYGIILFLCLFILFEMSIIFLVLFSFIATFFAIFAEWWDIKYIDDDFLMAIIPLLALSGLDNLLAWLGFL